MLPPAACCHVCWNVSSLRSPCLRGPHTRRMYRQGCIAELRCTLVSQPFFYPPRKAPFPDLLVCGPRRRCTSLGCRRCGPSLSQPSVIMVFKADPITPPYRSVSLHSVTVYCLPRFSSSLRSPRLAEAYDLDTDDSALHSHIPFVIILLKALVEWGQKEKGDAPGGTTTGDTLHIPTTPQEKASFKVRGTAVSYSRVRQRGLSFFLGANS